MKRSPVCEFSFDMEYGNKSVEYVAEFDVTPAERGTPRTMGDPGTPDWPASVDDVRVYLVTKKACRACQGSGSVKLPDTGCIEIQHTCPTCKGRKRITVKERRPELDDMVEESALLEHAAEECESARCDYESDEYDRRMDR